jgi:hypothetical protein
MSEGSLLFLQRQFSISLLSLHQQCSAPALQGVNSYQVTAQVSSSNFQLFIDALNGKDIQITNENISDLTQLATEFQCSVLDAKLLVFQTSSEHQLWLLKSRVSEQEKRIGDLAR